MSTTWIEQGSVTSTPGFVAGGSYAGIKKYGPEPRRDVGLLFSEHPCTAAAVFTTNAVCGAPVVVSKEHIRGHRARGVVANSGCSNVAMGETGLANAREMAQMAAGKLGLAAPDVLVTSTGVIARPLPMDKVRRGIEDISLSRDPGGSDFARAIMTTDNVPKQRALTLSVGGRKITIAGTAKGSGMAQPNMATVLCFVTSDVPVDGDWAQACLRRVTDNTLNMLNVDMDTSTSDSLIWLSNGLAGGESIHAKHPDAAAVEQALELLLRTLTKDLARDAEGARALLEVRVEGAATIDQARAAAHTIVSSPLVKTMVTGRDPNIGRILMAAGRSGAKLDLARLHVEINGVSGYSNASYQADNEQRLIQAMDAEEVLIRVDLASGKEQATAWGCDLTEEYIRVNADYTT